MDQKMFCYQCQETAGCKGCTVVGVCGKQPDVAAMQDLLVWMTKGISAVTTRLREEGRAVADEVNHLITENMFTTVSYTHLDVYKRQRVYNASSGRRTVSGARGICRKNPV